VADELYRTARRLRVFTPRPVSRPLTAVVHLVGLPAGEIERRLARSAPLL
jgi:hypothetical protein